MDRVLSHVIPNRDTYVNPANPVDASWNVVVRHIATQVLPNGFDVVEKFADAPTTLEALTAYANEHGRLCIASEDCEGTIFDCADTNLCLRAWHDSVHYRHQLAFNVAGEAAAVYIQAAQVFHLYGVTPRSIWWVQLLLADILGLVINFKMRGTYPKNKRAAAKYAKQWRDCAQRIGKAVSEAAPEDHEAAALKLAVEDWG